MDEEKKPARSTADYANFKPDNGKKADKADKKYDPDKDRQWGKLLKYIIALLAIAAVIGAAYWVMLPDAAENKNQAAAPPPPPARSNVISTATEHFASQEFALEFDHPNDWKVEETSGKLTVTSPALSLTDHDGRRVDGQIVFTVRSKQQPLPEFDKGAATAARESEKIAYANPSQSQRGSTYISWLRYAASSGSERDYDGIYITGDNGYQKDQNAPKTDFNAVDPIISITYLKDGKQITVADNMWDDPDYSRPLKAMLQSITVQ